MVEFAFVGVVFIILVTGLITFGLLLSFKQNLTQAAAEGARAGAVAQSGNAVSAADTATNNAVDSFGQQCDSGALSCDPVPHDCDQEPDSGISDTAGVPQCITVEVSYDYSANPLFPVFPILGNAYPDTISASSTAEMNP